MKTFFRALPAWLILGGLSWVMATATGADMQRVLAVLGLIALPALAVWFTSRAAAELPQRWLGRVGFWTVTNIFWFALLVIAQGRVELHPLERQKLILALGLAVALALWLGVKGQRTRPFLTWRAIGETVTGVAVLAFAIGVYVWRYDAKTHSIAARAEARWTEIGLSLEDLEKTLAPEQENAGSEVVREVLRERVSSRFYKDGTRAGDREPAIVRSPATVEIIHRASLILSANIPPSDDIDLSSQPIAAIEPLAPALDGDYRRILATEPPAWATDPRDGFSMNVPNFLGIREFAQLAAVDAMRRFSVGDQEGAARAISAGLRLRERLRQNPTLVSLMIDVAVEALLTEQQVRLPASENEVQTIAQDLASLRAEFLRRLQIESWTLLRLAPEITDSLMGAPCNVSFLPKWMARMVNRPFAQRHGAIAALNGAEHAAIHQSPATLELPDLGEELHDAVSAKYPTPMEINGTRALVRIHAMILLREQTELIREARARFAAGRAVESRASVALPHAHWELIADEEKNTVATRLVGAPEWVMKNTVTGYNFWALPLDGSVAWKFRAPARAASR